MTTISPVATASIRLFERYKTMLDSAVMAENVPEGCSQKHLLWMCSTAIEHASTWPVDKLSRWLGFVQGVLTVQGILTVGEEREFSRPLFHAAYAELSLEAPASVGRTD